MQSSSHATGMRAFVLRRGGLRILAVLFTLIAQALPAQAQCDNRLQCCSTPAPGGDPDCASGPAQLPRGTPAAGAGNPLDIVSGNKYQKEVDLPALPGVLGLELVRHYNSARAHVNGHANGLIGRGWRLSYEATVHERGHALHLVQPDGTVLRFTRSFIDRDNFLAADPQLGSVRSRRRNAAVDHTWTWPDGRQLSFEHGKLVRIKAPTGEVVRIFYAPTDGRLLYVQDPQGRRLSVTHPDRRTAAAQPRRFRGIQRIDTPVGGFDYAHDDAAVRANLVKVTRPDGVSRLYHYEDARHPSLITGISVHGTGSDGQAMQQRLVTWGYDERGRAVSSVKGDGRDGIERVTVQRKYTDSGGSARLTNRLGQATEYRWRDIAGQHRLTQVRGPGCASCGDTNVRYGYDRQGRLTELTRLDTQGQPVETIRHAFDPSGASCAPAASRTSGAGRSPSNGR
jgi:YD repeat-containing protein